MLTELNDHDRAAGVTGLRLGHHIAVAAVATGASSQFSNEAKAKYQNADRLQKLIVSSRKDLKETTEKEEQQAVLDNLRLKSTR